MYYITVSKNGIPQHRFTIDQKHLIKPLKMSYAVFDKIVQFARLNSTENTCGKWSWQWLDKKPVKQTPKSPDMKNQHIWVILAA